MPLVLPCAAVPEGVVPMKLPVTVFPPLVVSTMPVLKPPITSPRTVLSPAVIVRAVPPAVAPSSSTRRTASSPTARVLALAPGCV